ncbi:MAG TPA: Gldg family protein [Candidatus Udaeobacter sp.]|nr:Gldg family protein [Candidatus Udaeobacter sp.]
MRKKGFETYLYSAIGVAAMLVLLVVINVIAAQAKQRVDLTAEHAYTLSAGTRNILAKIDTPVQVRFYCPRASSAIPASLKNYAQRVEDLLSEYRQQAKGKIEVQKLDPEPDSDAEDSARLDGLQPQLLQNNERVYLGLSVSMLDQKETIPFLTPARERLLEYDVSRAIARVISAERPVIGVMSALPVAGQMVPGQMMLQQQNERPWILYSELQRDFTVRNIDLKADKIPEDVKLLLIIHPKGIPDATEFAIDQFLLRGGKLVAFLDPDCVLDPQASGSVVPASSSSSLDKLLNAWGLKFNTSLVVADLNHMGRTRQGQSPAVLALGEDALNQNDVLTAQTDAVMVLAGAFTGTPVAGLKETVLIKSSQNSQLIAPIIARGSGEEIMHNLKPSGTEYPLALRLTGKLKTAFPSGAPAPSPSPSASPTPTKPEPSPSLKDSKGETSIVLFGDVDMIQNQIAATEMNNLFGGHVFTPNNGNLALAEGAIEQLSGDSDLIAMRSRATSMRPFTVIREMQAKAEAHYQDSIRQLESSLGETQRKLSELQQTKQNGQQFILSPEQQKEISSFRQKEANIKAQLKEERRNLRADIDSLENRLKWVNIAAMPALVAFSGVLLAIGRRQSRAAR